MSSCVTAAVPVLAPPADAPWLPVGRDGDAIMLVGVAIDADERALPTQGAVLPPDHAAKCRFSAA